MTEAHDQERSSQLARQLGQRLEQDETYLAHLFAVMRSVEGLDDRGLAIALGAPIERVSRIALCRTPRDDMFREDVDEIAGHFGIDANRLAQLVRRGQTLSAFSHAYSGELLAAARDHAAEDRAGYVADDDPSRGPDGETENSQPLKPNVDHEGEER
jgi:hypothetical protein